MTARERAINNLRMLSGQQALGRGEAAGNTVRDPQAAIGIAGDGQPGSRGERPLELGHVGHVADLLRKAAGQSSEQERVGAGLHEVFAATFAANDAPKAWRCLVQGDGSTGLSKSVSRP